MTLRALSLTAGRNGKGGTPFPPFDITTQSVRAAKKSREKLARKDRSIGAGYVTLIVAGQSLVEGAFLETVSGAVRFMKRLTGHGRPGMVARRLFGKNAFFRQVGNV